MREYDAVQRAKRKAFETKDGLRAVEYSELQCSERDEYDPYEIANVLNQEEAEPMMGDADGQAATYKDQPVVYDGHFAADLDFGLVYIGVDAIGGGLRSNKLVIRQIRTGDIILFP